MALTKISTGGVKDDAASQAIIADEAVDEARLQVSNAGSNGQFLQKQSGNAGGLTWAAVPTQYTHPNHSGEVTSTADGAQVIASNIVDEDNLKISNSPTNGQLLSAQSGNTGGLTWTDPPASAPQITATADGSISANAAVIIKSDGKVASVTGYTTAGGANTQFSADLNLNHRSFDVACNKTDNQAVVVYNNSGLKCKVATFSGTTPTFNSETSINTSGNAVGQICVCNVSSGVYIVAYAAGTDAYARVLTVSGTGSSASIAVGQDIDFSIGSGTFLYPNLETLQDQSNRALLVYVDDNAGDSGARVLTISGTGSSATIASTAKNVWLTSEATYAKTCWNSDDNLVTIFYKHSQQTSGYSTNLKVTNTTISDKGDQAYFTFGGTSADGAYDPVQNKYIALFFNAGNNYAYYKLGVPDSSLSINWNGNYGSIGGNSTGSITDSLRVIYDDFTGYFNVFYGKATTLYMKVYKWNDAVDNLVDAGDGEITVAASDLNTNGESQLALLNNGRIITTRKESGNSGAGRMIVRQNPGTTLSTKNFIGFSSAAYSDGNTATINVVGSTTTQSSLTPAETYYVQNDGSLGTTAAIPSIVAGTSLSSTKLLIKN